MKRTTSLFLIAMVIVGCAGTNFQWENVDKLKAGMSKEDVVALLGQPTSVTTVGDKNEVLGWSYANALTSAKSVGVSFQNGKVTSVSHTKIKL